MGQPKRDGTQISSTNPEAYKGGREQSDLRVLLSIHFCLECSVVISKISCPLLDLGLFIGLLDCSRLL